MPLDEEGNKWSCEPCVRGHRSSKCQHFDRMMMKVPKAGRPLAKCPHPKGTCSCQKLYAFMVRIPKGSTCLCRPLYKVPMVVTETGQTPTSQPTTPAMQGPVPTAQATPNVNANRVQKRTTKRQNSGRSIADVPTQDLESLSSLPAEQSSELPSTPGQPSSATWNPDYNAHQPINGATQAVIPEATGLSDPVGGAPKQPSPPSQVSHGTPATNEKKSSCCCSGKSAPKSPPKPLSSCCSKSTAATTVEEPQEIKQETVNSTQSWPHAAGDQPIHRSHPGTQLPMNVNPMPISSFSHPPAPQLPDSMSAPITNYSSPILPPQWGNSNHMSSQHAFQVPAGVYHPDSSGVHGDPAHLCNCGDGCQCLGCASHPYNNTTLQHIQEMGFMMATGEDDRSVGSPPDHPGPSPPSFRDHNEQPYSNTSGYAQYLVNNNADPHDHRYGKNFEHLNHNPGADPLNTIPGLGPQTQGEAAMMQPSEYFTLEYPINFLDPCTNMTGTCQCGVNCACVGCLTHRGHNGVPLEPSPPPDNTEFTAPNLEASGSTAQISPSLQIPSYAEGSNDHQTNPS